MNCVVLICDAFGIQPPGGPHERGQDGVCAGDGVCAVENLRTHHRTAQWRRGSAHAGLRRSVSYNSCRNRHCPKCQAQARERWLEARRQELLDTGYFHVVFTVPHELNPLALTNPALFYDLLFSATAQTLLEVAANPRRLRQLWECVAHLKSPLRNTLTIDISPSRVDSLNPIPAPGSIQIP